MMKRALLLLGVVGVMSGVAYGVPLPTISIVWDGGSWQKTYTEGEITPNGQNDYYLHDAFTNHVFDASWDLTFRSDPYVISYVSLTNSSGSGQIYTMTFEVPVSPPIEPTSLYSGSVGGSLTTDPTGGYVKTVSPTPLYLGKIDATEVLPLYSHPSLWSKAGGGTTIIPLQSAGPLLDGPAMSTISIQHRFELGSHDAVALTGYFEAVPEPTTMALLALGGVAVMRRRRA